MSTVSTNPFSLSCPPTANKESATSSIGSVGSSSQPSAQRQNRQNDNQKVHDVAKTNMCPQTSQVQPTVFSSHRPDKQSKARIKKIAKLNAKLMQEAKNGVFTNVSNWVAKGASIHKRDKEGHSLLHYAVQYKNLQMVTSLLLSGAEIDATMPPSMMPLLQSSLRNGEPAAARLLLEKMKGHDCLNKTHANKKNLYHFAAKSREPQCTQLLLHAGIEGFAARNNKGRTPLQIAARRAHVHCTRLLIEGFVNVFGMDQLLDYVNDKADPRVESALTRAALYADPYMVQTLLEYGAKIDDPLLIHHILAAEEITGEEIEIIKLLYQVGASLHAFNEDKETPLHLACEKGCKELVQFLLEQGVPVNHANCDGETALHLACKAKKQKKEIIDLLLKAHPDVNAKDHFNQSPLLNLMKEEIGEEEETEILKALHCAGASLKDKDEDGDTLLHMACQEGNQKLVQFLLGHGAEINAKNNQQETPLNVACDDHGKHRIVESLIASGADVNHQDKDGIAPLHKAAYFGLTSIAGLLLENNSEVLIRDQRGWTPLTVAIDAKNEKVVDLFFQKASKAKIASDLRAFLTALNLNWWNWAASFLKAGLDINSFVPLTADTNALSASPLQLACFAKNIPVIHFLLDHNADVNSTNVTRETALHLAALAGQPEACKALLDARAVLEAVDCLGNTPLHNAAQSTSPEVVRMLLASGADVTKKNADGKTPLELASANKNKAVLWSFEREIKAESFESRKAEQEARMQRHVANEKERAQTSKPEGKKKGKNRRKKQEKKKSLPLPQVTAPPPPQPSSVGTSGSSSSTSIPVEVEPAFQTVMTIPEQKADDRRIEDGIRLKQKEKAKVQKRKRTNSLNTKEKKLIGHAEKYFTQAVLFSADHDKLMVTERNDFDLRRLTRAAKFCLMKMCEALHPSNIVANTDERAMHSFGDALTDISEEYVKNNNSCILQAPVASKIRNAIRHKQSKFSGQQVFNLIKLADKASFKDKFTSVNKGEKARNALNEVELGLLEKKADYSAVLLIRRVRRELVFIQKCMSLIEGAEAMTTVDEYALKLSLSNMSVFLKELAKLLPHPLFESGVVKKIIQLGGRLGHYHNRELILDEKDLSNEALLKILQRIPALATGLDQVELSLQ